jgi:hypothetical protein
VATLFRATAGSALALSYVMHAQHKTPTLKTRVDGAICNDGRYQFVTKLAADIGTGVESLNNKHQLAIHGRL